VIFISRAPRHGRISTDCDVDRYIPLAAAAKRRTVGQPFGEPPTLSNLPTASFRACLCVISRGFQHMT
jgi:hypothetical protein